MLHGICRSALIAGALLLATAALGADVVDRYPNRLPEWLWDVESTAHLLTADELISLRRDIDRHAALSRLSDPQADLLGPEIAARLARKFAVRDLARDAFAVRNPAYGIDLAVRMDPAFSPQASRTIRGALRRLMQVALDDDVIRTALARATALPAPVPGKYETREGQVVVDEAGRKVLTPAYAFFLRQRALPASAQDFAAHLKGALSSIDGDPALLVVSSYQGKQWWASAYTGYSTEPMHRLAREAPGRGYLYISINTDKLLAPEPGWDDQDFWASKIGHELLHNLGYWHPAYKDPAERNANNAGMSWAFIVSYEAAILERLRRQ